MQLNPIIVREFRARWRSWRAFAIVLGYAILLALAVGLLYASSIRPSDYHGVPVRRMAQIGHELFVSLTAMQVFAWMLLAPALTATSIAGEREDGMLDLLQMSPLSPWRIVWGKMMAAMSFIFLMMLAPLPVTALCFLMGGVSPQEFLIAILLQSMTAICGAVIGLFCSAWCRRASTALCIAFAIMGAWGLGSGFAAIFQNSFGRANTFWLKEIGYLFAEVFWRTNPLLAVFDTASFNPRSAFLFSYDIPNWTCTVAFEALLAIALLYSAMRAVRRPLQEPLEKEERQKVARPRSGPLVVTVGAKTEARASPEVPADQGVWSTPGSTARSTPEPRYSTWWEASWASALRFRNPVLHREMQRKLRIRKPPPKIRALLKALAVITFLLYCWGFFYAMGESHRDREIFFYLPAFLFLIIVSVAASSMSATAFPRERETHTWESLRLSLLTPHQIVMGKLLPPLVVCWVATLILFVFLSPTIALWTAAPVNADWSQRGLAFSQFSANFLVFCSTIWCYSCWGLLVSWWCRRSWIAVTVTISSLIFVLVFIPIFFFLSTSGGSSQWVEEFLAIWHPFFAMIEIANQSWRQSAHKLTTLVTLYVFITTVAGYMCLGLLYREIVESMRDTVPWSLKMDE